MENLALRFRPKSFDDLAGQRAVQVMLRQMVVKQKVPHALLFDGSRGTGKTTTARILAAALNCDTPPVPCGTCPSCIATFNGTSMDVIEIDAASNGLVDNIRDLRQQLVYRTTGKYRIIIFDEAHSASTAAFNAFLKTLEEPPDDTVFILITTEPHKIPDTIVSRCMPFNFRRLSVIDIKTRLEYVVATEQLTIDDDLLTVIAERADGAMRDAIMLLDQLTSVGVTTTQQYERLVGEVDVAPALISALLKGDIAHAFALLDAQLVYTADYHTLGSSLVSVLRDVLVLRCHGDITKTGQALTHRQNLALALDTHTVFAAMKVLWDLKTRLRLDDARSSLELAVVMLSEALCPTPQTTHTPTRKLSVEQMGTYVR